MIMRGTVIYGAGDVRFEHLLGPRIRSPGDAIARIAATCVCGSDLWDYRGILKGIQDVDVCGSVPSYGALIAAVSMRIAPGIAGFHAQPHAARPRILKGEVAETISDVDSLDPGPHTGNGQRR